MTVKILETGEYKELSYLYDGINCANDVVCNHTYDPEFETDDYGLKTMIMDEETFEFWEEYFDAEEQADKMLDSFKDDLYAAGYSYDNVSDIINNIDLSTVGCLDLIDQPAAIMTMIAEMREEILK